MDMQLQYINTLSRYCSEQSYQQSCWSEIEAHYKEPHRHYHTLTHVERMLTKLEKASLEKSLDERLFLAALYHDVIYNPRSEDNEEFSAELAKSHLAETSYPDTEKVAELILATRNHVDTEDNTTALFLDCDLAILGEASEQYRAYTKQIRQEYGHLDDATFYQKRLTVLRHFLRKEHIYQTTTFKTILEERARRNIISEIEDIKGFLT